ncbi:MAG: DUF362 domain-containing protein [Planctomycetaceae bacterium]|nr:DUF362 domain-containing protein [Planctomycetaceae bacterium]
MSKPAVYFTNLLASDEENRQAKLARLIRSAGLGDIDMAKKFVAIKIHFGEMGNLAFLRPNYARTVVDAVKSQGGKPFLTDCNTLYVGYRKNALDHLDTAYTNGFSPFSTGCHIIIADGLKGTDESVVPIPNGEVLKEARIGRAVHDADVIISLNHFKCHELTGIGGAIKNIGMGSGSRAGKMVQHNNGKPEVEQEKCIGCGKCARTCAFDAPKFTNRKACIDHALCVGCGRCIGVCPTDAIHPTGDNSEEDVSKRMAEYAAATLAGKPHFRVSLVVEVSPLCDCHFSNDVPIVPDVGMFASRDPVALDQACAEAVLRQPIQRGSALERAEGDEPDYFRRVHPTTNWHTCLDHAAKLGLGSTEYELVTI